MTIWAPGMRCVCVTDDWEDERAAFPRAGNPVKGKIYEIDGVETLVGRTWLSLTERDLIDFLFDANAFRPLSETRLDQFREHLNRMPAGKVSA